MDIDLDLAKASREALVAVIAELMASNGQLRQQVAALEARLNTRGSPGLPANAQGLAVGQQTEPQSYRGSQISESKDALMVLHSHLPVRPPLSMVPW